jgi:hypothetical protein
MYYRCPRQYQRVKIDKEPKPPGIAMLQGTALHTAAEQNHKQKIASHEDMKLADLMQIAGDSFSDRVSKEGVHVAKSELPIKDQLINDGQQKSLFFTKIYREGLPAQKVPIPSISQTIQPVIVEEEMILEIPGLPPIKMVMDVFTENNVVRDLKSGSGKKPKILETDLQMRCYFLGAKQKNLNPSGVQMDRLIITHKGNPGAESLVAVYTDQDLQHFINAATWMFKEVERGNFPKRHPSSCNTCAPKWCGYYDECWGE